MSLPFHLCQPGGRVSCGACCGLYNFKDHSRAAVTESLERHTARLRETEHTPQAFHAAARELKAQDPAPLFTQVRVCPMLGFLDAERTRVGCLAHPKVTGGPDLRDCGVYSATVCEQFECPSFLWLDEAQATWVREASPDWYLYGLVVTDVEFVRGCLKLIAEALVRPVPMQRLWTEEPARAASARLFALKERAEGRADGAAVFGRFDPDGTGDAHLRTLNYPALGLKPAPEDDVVLCLGHAPRDRASLEQARAEVAGRVAAVVRALAAEVRA